MVERPPKEGEVWAYRARPYTENSPVIAAEILQFGPPKSNKVRVKYLDGEFDGLDEWVPRIRLKVPWDQAEPWLRDERRLIEAREAFDVDQRDAKYIAVDEIFMAYPRDDALIIGFPANRGATVEIDDLELVCEELGLEANQLLDEPLSFIDKFGAYIAPWPVAVELAKRVAKCFPEDVLKHIEDRERNLIELSVPGAPSSAIGYERTNQVAYRCQEELRRNQPAFELVRRWCGEDAIHRFQEVQILRERVASMRSLLEKALAHLEGTNQRRVALRIRREYEQLTKR